jgi:hypothetical protein
MIDVVPDERSRPVCHARGKPAGRARPRPFSADLGRTDHAAAGVLELRQAVDDVDCPGTPLSPKGPLA